VLSFTDAQNISSTCCAFVSGARLVGAALTRAPARIYRPPAICREHVPTEGRSDTDVVDSIVIFKSRASC
jgi:hypothetical protein